MAHCFAGLAPVAGVEQHVEIDSPEAWAMAYTASAFAPSPTRAPEDEEPGALLVGGDATYWRRLSTREEQVGFDGTAPESMDRSPLLGDLRVEAGLPGAVVAALTWTPPVDVRGVRADVVSAALRRVFWRDGAWRLDARVYGTLGRITGDITSDEATANAAPGSPGNPLSTDGESHDILNWRMMGANLLVTRALDDHGCAAFAGVEGALLHATFHVHAEEVGVVDRTVNTTASATGGAVVGASCTPWVGVILGAAAEYIPLRIARPGARESIDPFATGRLSLTVRL